MKAKYQETCLELDICIVDKDETGLFVIYGLEKAIHCDFIHDALELAFEQRFSYQEIVITKKARMKDV